MTQGGDLKADILKVPHHGGRTSSLRSFLQAVRPRVAVISVGIRNHFGHPHPEALARYQAIGARVYRTDQDGAIVISTNGHRLFVKTFEESRWTKIEEQGLKGVKRFEGFFWISPLYPTPYTLFFRGGPAGHPRG